MGDADLEAEAWRAAAACEMEEAGTPAGGAESQKLAETLTAPLYGMDAILADLDAVPGQEVYT